MSVEQRDYDAFQKTVRRHYKTHQRTLPWRETRDPYRILVSEIMLQQTQVKRVQDKYPRFIARFPDFLSLAAADAGDVITQWVGLGYNRRALNLYRCARFVVDEYHGVLPENREALERLPGIGPYTARAVTVFAHNRPEVMIETNIRAVYLHHFFQNVTGVHDRDILPIIAATLPRRNPREWYYALMDYGAHLKRALPNPSRKSAHHTTQSRFEGSRRQIRGAIVRILARHGRTTKRRLMQMLHENLPNAERSTLDDTLDDLVREGLVRHDDGGVSLITTEGMLQ